VKLSGRNKERFVCKVWALSPGTTTTSCGKVVVSHTWLMTLAALGLLQQAPSSSVFCGQLWTRWNSKYTYYIRLVRVVKAIDCSMHFCRVVSRYRSQMFENLTFIVDECLSMHTYVSIKKLERPAHERVASCTYSFALHRCTHAGYNRKHKGNLSNQNAR
jgi:hypothetical protein